MATLLPTTFTRYALTEDELRFLPGSVSQVFLYHLQNIQADIAEQKLGIEINPSNVLDYVQQEAYLAGQLALVRTLFDTVSTPQAVPPQTEEE